MMQKAHRNQVLLAHGSDSLTAPINICYLYYYVSIVCRLISSTIVTFISLTFTHHYRVVPGVACSVLAIYRSFSVLACLLVAFSVSNHNCHKCQLSGWNLVSTLASLIRCACHKPLRALLPYTHTHIHV